MGRLIEIEGEKFEVGSYVNYLKADKTKTIICEVLNGSEDNVGLQLLYRQGNRKTVFFVDAKDVKDRIKHSKYTHQQTQEPTIQEEPRTVQPNQPIYSSGAPGNYPDATKEYNYRQGKGGIKSFFGRIGNIFSSKNLTMPQDTFLKELLMFAALLVHVIDFFVTDLSIDSNALPTRMALYFILILFSALIVGQFTHYFQAFFKFLKPALIIIFAFPLINYIAELLGASTEVMEVIAGFALLLPLYALYLLYGSGIDYSLPGHNFWSQFKNALIRPSGWVRILTWILFVYIMIYLIIIITQMASFGSDAAGLSGTGIDFSTAKEGLKKIFQLPINTIINIGTRANETYWQMHNDSLGEYYTGQVEQTKELTGVFITELRTMGTYYEGQPVELFATLKMRSFVDEINMTTNCYAKDMRGDIVAQGETDPKEITNVFREDYRGVKCSLPNNLTRGRYEIFFEIEFNFETWAYITMSIMDREFLTSLYMDNVDVTRRYNIQPRIRTIYTRGPVMLGLNDNMEMPLAISTREGQINNIPLGITIDDRPQPGTSGGEILRVNSFVIRTPSQFEITKERCIMPPGITNIDIGKDDVTGYTIYSFNTNEDYPGKYLTVSCNAQVSHTGARSILNDPTGKRDITIAGSTTYDYKLTRRTSIDIRNI